MIKEKFLFPQYYIHRIPMCDDCNEELKRLPYELLSSPPQYQFQCPKCNKTYRYYDYQIQGEWKWREI